MGELRGRTEIVRSTCGAAHRNATIALKLPDSVLMQDNSCGTHSRRCRTAANEMKRQTNAILTSTSARRGRTLFCHRLFATFAFSARCRGNATSTQDASLPAWAETVGTTPVIVLVVVVVAVGVVVLVVVVSNRRVGVYLPPYTSMNATETRPFS